MSWWLEESDEWAPPEIEVDWIPPRFIGTLLDHRGEVLLEVYEPPAVAFGFQPRRR